MDDPIANVRFDFRRSVADVAGGFDGLDLGALAHEVYLAQGVGHLDHDRGNGNVDDVGVTPVWREVWNGTSAANECNFLK